MDSSMPPPLPVIVYPHGQNRLHHNPPPTSGSKHDKRKRDANGNPIRRRKRATLTLKRATPVPDGERCTEQSPGEEYYYNGRDWRLENTHEPETIDQV